MKNLSKKLLGPVQIVVLALIISSIGSFGYAASYSEPVTGCSAPSCNPDAPLNVSGASQIKVGRLTVASGGGITTGLEVINGDLKVDAGNAYANAFFYNSDRNLKQNIAPLNDALSKVLQLQGVSFNWKKDGTADVGVIAQDVQKVYPELVTTKSDGTLAVQEGNLVAPLIEAVKAQQKEIDQLKSEVNSLKASKR